MAVITKELAIGIAKKLNAKILKRKRKKHDLAQIYHKGQLVAFFGIRRGSNMSLGHDFVPAAIYASPRNARLLGQCPMSREEWINQLTEKGLI